MQGLTLQLPRLDVSMPTHEYIRLTSTFWHVRRSTSFQLHSSIPTPGYSVDISIPRYVHVHTWAYKPTRLNACILHTSMPPYPCVRIHISIPTWLIPRRVDVIVSRRESSLSQAYKSPYLHTSIPTSEYTGLHVQKVSILPSFHARSENTRQKAYMLTGLVSLLNTSIPQIPQYFNASIPTREHSHTPTYLMIILLWNTFVSPTSVKCEW